MAETTPKRSLRLQTEQIIFGTGTPAGQWFDILLLVAILTSVTAVMLNSIASYHESYGRVLGQIEVSFTVLFTIEYATRIWVTRARWQYIRSFWGLVDLIAILPTYLALFITGADALTVVRLLRVLRVFRVLRLFALFREFLDILKVLRSTSSSMLVFGVLVSILMVIFGCLLYVIEGPKHGFTSIPMSIYWAVVTITTVGYGDLVPQTPLGRAIASAGMLVGYAIIAVPTAIITSKLWERLNDRRRHDILDWNCPVCARGGHTTDAEYCKHCGASLDVPAALRDTEA